MPMFSYNWQAQAPESTARQFFNGPGAGPMRGNAEAYHRIAEALEELAQQIQSQMDALIWSGDAADRARRAYEEYVKSLRRMSETAEEASAKAQQQADDNSSARSSMIKEAVSLATKLAALAALAAQKYPQYVALWAQYMGMWESVASLMNAFQGQSSSNTDLTEAEEATSISEDSGASESASQMEQMMDSMQDPLGEEFGESPYEDSPLLSQLDDLERSLGGGGGGLGGGLGMSAGALPGLMAGFAMPNSWSPGKPGGFAIAPLAAAPVAGGPMGRGGMMPPPMMHGAHGGSGSRRRTAPSTAIVTPDFRRDAPAVELPVGIGVITEDHDADADGRC